MLGSITIKIHVPLLGVCNDLREALEVIDLLPSNSISTFPEALVLITMAIVYSKLIAESIDRGSGCKVRVS